MTAVQSPPVVADAGAASGAPQRPSVWAELRHGATRPSGPALIGMLAVALAWLLGCITFLTPARIAQLGGGWFMESDEDEYAALLADTLRLRTLTPGPREIVIIGASSTREAITSAEDLEELVSTQLGEPVHVRLIAGGGLFVWEIAAVVDQLPPHLRGTVLVEISERQVTRARDLLQGLVESPRLPLDSPAFDAEVRTAKLAQPHVWTDNYFLRHYQFFVARPLALLNLVRGPVTPCPHMTARWRPPTEAEWRRIHETAGQWVTKYDLAPANFAVYGRILGAIRQRGLQPALFQPPRNPKVMAEALAERGAADMFARYTTDLEQFAQQQNTPLWTVQDEAAMTPDDFFDGLHVKSDAARERYTAALAKHIADQLRTAPKAESQP